MSLTRAKAAAADTRNNRIQEYSASLGLTQGGGGAPRGRTMMMAEENNNITPRDFNRTTTTAAATGVQQLLSPHHPQTVSPVNR